MHCLYTVCRVCVSVCIFRTLGRGKKESSALYSETDPNHMQFCTAYAVNAGVHASRSPTSPRKCCRRPPRRKDAEVFGDKKLTHYVKIVIVHGAVNECHLAWWFGR